MVPADDSGDGMAGKLRSSEAPTSNVRRYRLQSRAWAWHIMQPSKSMLTLVSLSM